MLNFKTKNKLIFLILMLIIISSTCIANDDLNKVRRDKLLEFTDDDRLVDEIMNNIYKKDLQINYNNKSRRDIGQDPVVMYIITIDEYEGAFEKFASIKKKEGIHTVVVTKSETGNTPYSIRLWLREKKQQNKYLKYVLIGGDENAIPIHTFFYYSYYGELKFATTDFYYSNVLSEWSDDNFVEDIDPTTDLYVGRVPARNRSEVDLFTSKYKSYRKNNTQYSDAMSFIATNIQKKKNVSTDNNVLDSLTNHVPNTIDKDLIYTYDLVDTVNGCAQPVVDELQNRDFSFLYLSCHGGDAYCIYNSEYDEDSTWVWEKFGPHKRQDITICENRVQEGGGWYNDDYSQDSCSYYYTSSTDNYRQLEDVVPDGDGQNYVAWIASCYTSDLENWKSQNQEVLRGPWGQIIQTHHYPEQPGDGPVVIPDSEIPEWQDNPVQCISEAFFNEGGGPVALYTSSVYDFPYLTSGILEEYFDMLFINNIHKLGELTRDCWTSWFQYFPSLEFVKEMYVGFTLFGDPSMDVWSGPAERLYTNYTQGKGFQAYNASGDPVKATIVILNENDEIIARGISPFKFDGEIKNNYTITANSANHIQSCNSFEKLKKSGNTDEMLYSNSVIDLRNFPNPFSSKTEISFSLPKSSNVELKVYNIKGQKINTLKQGEIDKGNHTFTWNGNDNYGKSVKSGIYFFKLRIDEEKEIKKKCMIINK